MNQNPVQYIDLKIGPLDIPRLFDEFIKLAGQETIESRKLSKKHKYYPAINYYLEHKNDDWIHLDIPGWVMSVVNQMGIFFHLKKVMLAGSRGKPVRALLKPDLIDPFCQEAMIVSHYLRRFYTVSWNSIHGQDPPDLIVADPKKNIFIDFEVKVKIGKGTIETMFDSLSKGLQSLKRRKSNATNKMAVVVIHNSDDLNWESWLTDPDVMKRFQSRLSTDDYKIISGVVFSGGENVRNKLDGAREYGTKYAAFRSDAATYPLPYGFLTSTSDI